MREERAFFLLVYLHRPIVAMIGKCPAILHFRTIRQSYHQTLALRCVPMFQGWPVGMTSGVVCITTFIQHVKVSCGFVLYPLTLVISDLVVHLVRRPRPGGYLFDRVNS